VNEKYCEECQKDVDVQVNCNIVEEHHNSVVVKVGVVCNECGREITSGRGEIEVE